MIVSAVLALSLLGADPVAGTPRAASFNPRALELFDSDPVLMAWALREHDQNRDGWLSLFEAQAASGAFRRMADRDADGHVTVREYRDALAYARLRLGVK